MCFTSYASAEEDLYIQEWAVDANLIDNGNLQISEDITFKFNEEYNGVFRDIVLNKTSGVSDIMVQELANGTVVDYTLANKARNGNSGIYTVKEKNNKAIIKIFSPSEDEKKTFRISYIVHNVAVKYKDTGELYYKFIGKDNETPIGSFIININLPEADNENKVKVFAHGPLNGRISKISNKSYQLKVNKISANTFIEGRILFPAEFIENSKNYQDINRYSDIIDEENAYQDKIDKDRERKENLRKSLNKITLLATGISVAVLIILLYQCRRKINRDRISKEYSSIPEDCTPAIASLITGSYAGGKVIFATILDLFNKGYLRISGENDSIDIAKNENYIIYKTKQEDMLLLGHERYFMSWLFNDLGDGESVSTNDIEYYSKHSSTKFYESLTTWRKKVKAAAEKKGYYDKGKGMQGLISVLLSCVLIILGIITAVAGSIYSVISFILGIVFLVYGISLFYRLSDYGYERYLKWIKFKKYMKKHNVDVFKEVELNMLDSSLIYALSLNVTKKQIYKSGQENELYSMNSWVFWYLIFSGSDDNSFKKSINNSFVNNISDSTGSFSSGGGGGAGGGGAGGF